MDQRSKVQDQTSKDGVQTSTPLPVSDQCPFQLNGANLDHEVSCVDFLFNNVEVEVGSVYEIDHIHLPPRTPVQLRSIRVAMVSEKTELNVAVRFPSMMALKNYFSNSTREMYPALDEKFVMATALAAKVLLRQVPSQEFAANKHLEGFWLLNAAAVDVSEGDNCSRMGNCLTELKGTGMVRWGIRRQVKYLEGHKENINGNVQFIEGKSKRQIAAFGKPEEEEEGGGGDDEDDEKDEEKGEDDEDDERKEDKRGVDIANEETEAEEETQEMNRNLKRKRYKLRHSTVRKKAKKVKHEKKENKQKKNDVKRARNKCRELLVMENPIDRWSSERYQVATKNLLEVMKAKGARAGNPIIRPNLRAEARKMIGDTGLLDHLLKHMAGKLAPGGEVRFQRRHNADGAIEYWLESADLVNIRREAGVNDPYWIPPPGWRPGDCLTQDPICAKELRLLKEEYFDLQRNVLELVPRTQLEEELGKLRREIEKHVSNQEENQFIQVSSNDGGITENLDHLANLLVSSKSDLAKAPVPLEKYKEHLMVIQEFVKGIEEEIKRLMAESEGETRYDSALIVSAESGDGTEIVELEQRKKEEDVQEMINVRQEGSAKEKKTSTAAAATAEKKAAKIERLESGFRICKPQGTFLWPNMARNNTSTTSNMVCPQPQVVVQVEDLSVVPTPPSVSSSRALASPQLPDHHPYTTTSTNTYNRPASPVKPLAERRAITVTVSTLSNENGDHSYSTTSTTTTTTTANKKANPINLNDFPCNPVVEGFSGKSSSSQHTVARTTVVPPSLPGEAKRESRTPWEGMTGGASTGIGGASKGTCPKSAK